eukprot:scaffold23462_cov66-Phaeocystis_antarctica.AAC.11
MPHSCWTSPSSSGATGTNLTRLVTAVCSSGSRLTLTLTGGLATAAPWPPIATPASSAGLESEAKTSISSDGSDVTATSALAALHSATRGDGASIDLA